MNNHSPKPWKFIHKDYDDDKMENVQIEEALNYKSGCYAYNPFIVDANGENVVGHDEYNVFEGPNQVTNVALMLAAPDLLKALDDILIAMEASGGWEGDEELFTAGMSAIKKAKGE